MLAVNQISKSFNLAQILSEVTFTLLPGERAGLVGPNGCGKTTLLRIIMGQERADSGSVRLTPFDLVPGYLPQGFQFSEDETIRSYLNASTGDPAALDAQLEAVSARLASAPPIQRSPPNMTACWSVSPARRRTMARHCKRSPPWGWMASPRISRRDP